MRILIIDGQGGKLGKTLILNLKQNFPKAEILAVGTNTNAAAAMLKAGADKVAAGENPVLVACRKADIIVGPVGIVLADALMGEITPAMAKAVAQSDAIRVLIPMNLCDTYVAGIKESSNAIIEDAIEHIKSLFSDER